MIKKIILAAGCFWSVQFKLSKLKGVINTYAVYAGGHVPNPTYEEVCSDITGHAEAVLVEYDNEQISLKDLLLYFFEIHDASQENRQGPDIGTQYRSAIFYFDEEDFPIILKAIEIAQQSKYYRQLKISTEVRKNVNFYMAEEYHQHYYAKKGYL